MDAHRAEDFGACAAMWSDAAVTRYIGGRPSSRSESWMRILTYAGSWSLLGYGFWAVRDRRNGAFIGEAGFSDFHRDIAPGHDGIPEIGWVLMPSSHGQGFATEAVQAALAWADAALACQTTVCLIDAANAASLRLAAGAGYAARGQALLAGRPIGVFARARP